MTQVQSPFVLCIHKPPIFSTRLTLHGGKLTLEKQSSYSLSTSAKYNARANADRDVKEIEETLESVGFTLEMRQKPIASLSGGWKMKLSLARAMLWNADILLLDEPTNHLDVTNVAWLENYLTHLPTVTSILVSHDSGFLDNVCTGVASACFPCVTNLFLIIMLFPGKRHRAVLNSLQDPGQTLPSFDVFSVITAALPEIFSRAQGLEQMICPDTRSTQAHDGGYKVITY